MTEDVGGAPACGRAEEDLLVTQAIDGDQRSFAGLYDRYYDRVYRHLYYRVGKAEEAQDLTQQVFLRAWRALGRYQQRNTAFIAWLLTIANNLVIDFYRNNKNLYSLDSAITEWPHPERVEEPAEMHVEYERARRAMARLRPEQQLVLSMRFVDGLETKEVAAALGKSEGTVRVIQHRALHDLRRLMEREERS